MQEIDLQLPIQGATGRWAGIGIPEDAKEFKDTAHVSGEESRIIDPVLWMAFLGTVIFMQAPPVPTACL
ncbi:hypothetical protein MES5069_110038 [Mesorhizobium escarrei]|uniref:Uncharacterized protein n=1 Tax=Mesorhizobium escarrei TaxID=666018 RepID=A0ABM9DHX2_9HYPH|nr:hypothetical protein MES5069_110038 [Mesorhizobium escarrei]